MAGLMLELAPKNENPIIVKVIFSLSNESENPARPSITKGKHDKINNTNTTAIVFNVFLYFITSKLP